MLLLRLNKLLLFVQRLNSMFDLTIKFVNNLILKISNSNNFTLSQMFSKCRDGNIKFCESLQSVRSSGVKLQYCIFNYEFLVLNSKHYKLLLTHVILFYLIQSITI